MKKSALLVGFLLLSYVASCVLPTVLFTKKKVSTMAGYRITIYTLDNTSLLFTTPPTSAEQESVDGEDDVTTDDKNFTDNHLLGFIQVEILKPDQLLSYPLLSGSKDIPYSPPRNSQG